jgi:trehalose synthase
MDGPTGRGPLPPLDRCRLNRVDVGQHLQDLRESLQHQATHVHVAHQVELLTRLVREHQTELAAVRLWLVSSTARGGGVAEMLPRLVAMSRDLNLTVEWLVLDAKGKAKEFFALTKVLHNTIHGHGTPLEQWDGEDGFLAGLSAGTRVATHRTLFEAVGREASRSFFEDFLARLGGVDASKDVVIIHDPQPMAMVLGLKEIAPDMTVGWRCHIGSDVSNEATQQAWSFLHPYSALFDVSVFSAAEYVPASMASKSVIIPPGIAPLAPKNRELRPYECGQILLRAGLVNPALLEDEWPLIDPPFAHRARIYGQTKSARTPIEHVGLGRDDPCDDVLPKPALPAPWSMPMTPRVLRGTRAPPGPLTLDPPPSGLPIVFKPLITQISRWDRLKGFGPLLQAWILLKSDIDGWVRRLEEGSPTSGTCPLGPGGKVCVGCLSKEASVTYDRRRHKLLLEAACLCLAGPDPRMITDDPEGIVVLRELRAAYDALPPAIKATVFLCELPMHDPVENALIVNALQRSSFIIVQNSIAEGWGLTATEALFKRVPFIGTQKAVGLRSQVEHGVTGVLVQGDPSDPMNVGRALNLLIGDSLLREDVAVNGQRRATDRYLQYTQLSSWLMLFIKVQQEKQKKAAAAAPTVMAEEVIMLSEQLSPEAGERTAERGSAQARVVHAAAASELADGGDGCALM